MSVSDSYIVQYLLQNTLDPSPLIVWREKEHGFRTSLRGVAVDLDVVASRTGDRLFLTFAAGEHRVHIAEPLDLGLLNPKYENDDQRHLAAQMRELSREVARACAERRASALENPSGARELVFGRLLFSQTPEGVEMSGPPRLT